jgi:2-phospho-L-lactate/phosphoenolpyruvate guanylyltransferase
VKATAIIPVKRFAHAKRRLLERLDPPTRAALVEAMLTDVLDAVLRAKLLRLTIVVTGEARAERIALRRSQVEGSALEVLRDPDDAGHSEAATLGIIRAMSLGAEAVALLPGDCPLLDTAELDAALARVEPGRVAVVPDRHGTGTNCLLLCPPNAIGPAFGEGSCERHLARARAAAHAAVVENLTSLALDLDTPADLEALATAVAGAPDRAPATAAAVERLRPLGDLAG